MDNNTVTQKQIDDLFNESDIIEQVFYHKCLVMSIKLRNGFVIVESSACVDSKNFDITICREICSKRIKDKLWELEGCKLQCKLEGK